MPHLSRPPLQLLTSTEQAIAWLRSMVAVPMPGELRTDSRRVLPGDIFVAWPGAAHDGRQHVQAALRSGAVACLVEADDVGRFNFTGPRVAALPGLKAAAGAIAHAFAGKPSEALRVLAVTGTNGKTSISWWLAQALSAGGTRCGVVGTLGVGELNQAGGVGEQSHAGGVRDVNHAGGVRDVNHAGGVRDVNHAGGVRDVNHAGGVVVARQDLQTTGLTTPDAVTLQACLRVMADAGVQACAMEASSIGIEEHRLNALHIEVALFTNLTQDHLDYHHSMAAYGAAKKRLFAWPGLRAAVVNVDDAFGAQLAAELHGGTLQLWTVALDGGRPGAPARLQALNLRYDHAGLAFEVQEAGTPAGACITVRSALVGRFNASNLLVVLGGLRALGVPLVQACAALAGLQPVPGRMQRVAVLDVAAPVVGDTLPAAGARMPHGDVDVVVDYAHTPDALEQVLRALAPMAAARQGRLWCVVGCGGDRDASKRPLMGAAAALGAQQVVLTSDNPRSEDPARILQQMLAGIEGAALQHVVVIEDRRAAIRHAVLAAAPGDVVLLAGKGHERTQDVAGVKHPFSDEDEARLALVARAAAAVASTQPKAATAATATTAASAETAARASPASAPTPAAGGTAAHTNRSAGALC